MLIDTESLNSIEEIAATIAHEIKNPLSLVKANIELLELEDLENIYSKNYFVIKKELNKINEMMMDFLQLTKNQKDAYDIVYLYDVISNILESYSVTLGGNVNFTINCDDKELSVLGDEKNLEKVFSNIFKNAVEAIENSKGSIEITILKCDEKVVICFCDDGSGIKKNDINRIGETFYTTKHNGNGLGLAICKKIINEHNGSIRIKNNKTKGVTVTIIL